MPEERPLRAGQPEGRRVLVVEDDQDSRETLRLLLQTWGHHVEEAEDGARGVAMALSVRPAIAVIDVGLPGLDGYQAAKQIRAAPEGQRIFLIALTGYGRPEDRRRALEAGFDAHLVKPLDAKELAQLLATAGRGPEDASGR